MRKPLLTALLMASGLAGAYAAGNPALEYYRSDFRDSTPLHPLGDWTCSGSGKTAQDIKVGETDYNLRDFFPVGGPAFVAIDINPYGLVYCSNSTTEEGGAANEWLISPAIDLSKAPEKMMLGFDVLAFGSTTEPKFEVLATTSGTEPSDFTSPALYTGRVPNDTKYPVVTRVYKAVSGLTEAGTHLAFVNKSRNAQILGFYNIELAEYAINLSNPAPTHVSEPTDIPVEIELGLQTPVPCEGFSVVLDCNGEKQTYTSAKELGTTYTQTSITFPTPISIDYDQRITYTITVTPNYEGATPAVYSFDVSCTAGYPSTCVMEEGTATWCGWCIRGMVAIQQFSDVYQDRFIGIAVHGASDPMYQEYYVGQLKTQYGISAYPMACFNRTDTGNPYDPDKVAEILSQRSGYMVAIKEVAYDEEEGRVAVTYAPRLAFDTESADLTAAVVVTEDGLTGTGSDWAQTNYYSGYTQEAIEGNYGVIGWKYFKPYCEAPSIIRPADIQYDHVAQGIYNSFNGGGNGAMLPSVWKQDEEQEFTLAFDMPFQPAPGMQGVRDWKKTHMIVLLIDNISGRILSAARLGADAYKTAGLEESAMAHGVKVHHLGDTLTVELEGEAQVDIYNLHGFRLHSSHICGTTSIDASAISGPVIVSVSAGSESYVKKMIL